MRYALLTCILAVESSVCCPALAEDQQRSSRTLKISEDVRSLDWSPNGDVLVVETRTGPTANRVRRIELWHVADARQVAVLAKTSEPLFSVRFAPDGKAVACVAWARPNPLSQLLGAAKPGFSSEIRLWDSTTHKRAATLPGPPEEGLGLPFSSDLLRCAFSPDGRLIAAGGKLTGEGGTGAIAGSHIAGELCVWNTQSGKILWSDRSAHTDIVYAVAFSPDGKLLASGGVDKLIRLWDPKTGEVQKTLFGAAWDGVDSLAFSSDSRTLASGGRGREEGGMVRIWDVESGRLIRTLTRNTTGFQRGSPVRVAFAPTGTDFYAVGQPVESDNAAWQVQRWDARTEDSVAVIAEGSGHDRCISISPNGKLLAIGLADADAGVYLCQMAE